MTYREMMSLTLGEGWRDGRKGSLWCRLDATLDAAAGLTAELIWNDDNGEVWHDGDEEKVTYYSPQLFLKIYQMPGSETVTILVWSVDLTQEDARAIMCGPAGALLQLYAKEIEELRANQKA